MLATLVHSMLAAEPPARPTMRDVADRLLHIESEHVAVAKAIYQRHFRNNRALYAKFYARFFARCPEARAMFANIDEQYTKLDAALQALLDFPSGTRLSRPRSRTWRRCIACTGSAPNSSSTSPTASSTR